MTRSRFFAFGLLMLWVLLGHGLLLSWLNRQLPYVRPLSRMADPIFTRLVKPERLVLPVQRTMPGSGRPHVSSTEAVAPVTEPAIAPGHAADQINQNEAEEQLSVGVEAAEPVLPAVAGEPQLTAEEIPASDSWPLDTRVSYRLRGNYRGDIYGSARVQWQRQQSRYQVQLDLSMALVLQFSMISQGQVGPVGLLPGIYEERFPWGMRRMAFEDGFIQFDNGTRLPHPPDLQDTVSQFVELGHRFSSGREVLKVGRQVSVWLARPQGLALWTYDVVGEEILETPELGAVSALHLRPRPIANPAGVITAEIWFAPSLQYLPVRVLIGLGADNFVDLTVERIEQIEALVAPQTTLP